MSSDSANITTTIVVSTYLNSTTSSRGNGSASSNATAIPLSADLLLLVDLFTCTFQVTYANMVPGLVGNILSMLALWREVRKHDAYRYQLVIIASDLVVLIASLIYCYANFRLWIWSGLAPDPLAKSWIGMLTLSLSMPLLNAVDMASLIIAAVAAFERAMAWYRPFSYGQGKQRRNLIL